MTLPDHATGDLVSGEYYERYLRDLHIEFAERLSVPIILHICGRTVDRMEYIAQTGMAAFHYDSKNTPEESTQIVRDRISLVGNINNPETLFSKGPEVCATSKPASNSSARSAPSPCRPPSKTSRPFPARCMSGTGTKPATKRRDHKWQTLPTSPMNLSATRSKSSSSATTSANA
ncbi:MAG: hypothetical protein J4F35_02835 [Candidatus Latescibacteria bacterium]|nr:hypothetical protein [Candidatus Latescibacterota bacterium]